MKNTAIDCSKADSMMMAEPSSSMQAPKPSGDVDKDFAHTMMVHTSAMMAMMKAEVACGKDAKTRASAQRLLDQATENTAELQTLFGGGG